MARPAHLLRILLQHGAERLDPGGQAETLETRGYFLEGLTHRPARHGGRIRAKSLHGVAFLSWYQHPEPTGSRRATPLLLFQHSPGHFQRWSDSHRTPVAQRAFADLAAITFNYLIERQEHRVGHVHLPCCPDTSGRRTTVFGGVVLSATESGLNDHPV